MSHYVLIINETTGLIARFLRGEIPVGWKKQDTFNGEVAHEYNPAYDKHILKSKFRYLPEYNDAPTPNLPEYNDAPTPNVPDYHGHSFAHIIIAKNTSTGDLYRFPRNREQEIPSGFIKRHQDSGGRDLYEHDMATNSESLKACFWAIERYTPPSNSHIQTTSIKERNLRIRTNIERAPGMHTTVGYSYLFHHDGDFSGDVKITNIKTAEHVVTIPFTDLKLLFAECIVSQKIAQLENSQPDEILGLK